VLQPSGQLLLAAARPPHGLVHDAGTGNKFRGFGDR
jgi:hypothetical protein